MGKGGSRGQRRRCGGRGGVSDGGERWQGVGEEEHRERRENGKGEGQRTGNFLQNQHDNVPLISLGPAVKRH